MTKARNRTSAKSADTAAPKPRATTKAAEKKVVVDPRNTELTGVNSASGTDHDPNGTGAGLGKDLMADDVARNATTEAALNAAAAENEAQAKLGGDPPRTIEDAMNKGKTPSTRTTTAAKMVTVRVLPLQRPLTLTDDQGKAHEYPAGTTSMPKAHASHWYAAANGVELEDDGE